MTDGSGRKPLAALYALRQRVQRGFRPAWGTPASSLLFLRLFFLCLFFLWLMRFGPVARAQEGAQPKDEMDVYRQITHDLQAAYPQMVCHHNLNVVLALDTSGSMSEVRLNSFHTIWHYLLTYFFKPGDTFTLLPFHTHVLKAPDPQAPELPITRPYPERPEDVAKLEGWFTDARYMQNINGKGDGGTSLYLAQQMTLQTAQILAAPNGNTVPKNSSHSVLVLVVTDDQMSNPNRGGKTADEAAGRTLPDLLKQFRQPGEQTSAGSFPNTPYRVPLGNNKFWKLVLFHTAKNDGSPQIANLGRKVYLKSPGTQQEPLPVSDPDPREGWALWGIIWPIVGGLVLLLMKAGAQVDYEPGKGKGDNTKTVSIGQRIEVYALESIRQPNRHEIYLYLDKNPQEAVKLCSINLWSLGKARIQAASGATLMTGDHDTQHSVLEARYGSVTKFKVARNTDPADYREITLQPRPGMSGKELPLLAAILGIVGCLFFVARECCGDHAGGALRAGGIKSDRGDARKTHAQRQNICQ
jgi:hypothetical protein